ncbi:hypothetical protein COO60DRAFT_252409 [Scenedesmus sp. NREL 46B-D3]|nr:hypothetical protein COO60DRAFT_252409 [Scenedesmus sp. NREL 46B-D3]
MACGAYACSTCPAVSLRQAALLWPEASSSAQILQDNASTVDCVTLLHHVLHAHLMQSMYKSRHGVAHVTEQLHCSVAAWLSAESRGRHHNVSRVHSSQQHCTWHHCIYCTVHANAAHFTQLWPWPAACCDSCHECASLCRLPAAVMRPRFWLLSCQRCSCTSR